MSIVDYRQEFLDRARSARVIGIVRAHQASQTISLAESLAARNIGMIEVSLSSPRAVDAIGLLRAMNIQDLMVGAGTVCTLDGLESVANAGAQFYVSPNYSAEIVERADELGIAAVPGCMTPTEMLDATARGAAAVKLFPASVWNPSSLRDLLQAVPNLACIPTGGISPDDAHKWIDHGALAVGMASALGSLSHTQTEQLLMTLRQDGC